VYKDPEARRRRDERISSLGRSRIGKSSGTKGKTWEEIYGAEKAQEMREKLKNRIHENKGIQRRKSETLKKTHAENGGLNHKDGCQCGVCKAKRGEYVGDGKFWITSHGKHINPDFRDTDGGRVVIEVFCDYWKERTYGSVEQYLDERKEQCEDQGYVVVFLNDADVKEGDEHIRDLIENVHKG
jgi:hypothetical protein